MLRKSVLALVVLGSAGAVSAAHAQSTAFVPDGYAPLQALYDKITSAAWAPEVSFTAQYARLSAGFFGGVTYPSGCKNKQQQVAITYTDMAQATHAIDKTKLRAVGYRGDAVNCRPNGQGVIVFDDGSVWIGAVRSSGDPKSGVIQSIPVGIGMRRALPDQVYPIRVEKYRAIYGSSSGRKSTYVRIDAGGPGDLIAAQQAEGWPIDTRKDPAYSGGMRNFRYASGAIAQAYIFEDGRQVTSDTQITYPDGITASGADLVIAEEPRLAGRFYFTLPTKRDHLPAGRYRYLGSEQQRKMIADKSSDPTKPGVALDPRAALLVESRSDVNPSPPLSSGRFDHARFAAMLKESPANLWGCREPDILPPGWIVWWSNCIAPAQGTRGLTEIFSPDGTQKVGWVWEGAGDRPMYFEDFRAPFGTTDVGSAKSFSGSDYLTPVDGRVQINAEPIERGYSLTAFVYEGPFQGLRPHGDGRCRVAAKTTAPFEPCTFDQGRRIDSLHKARVAAVIAGDAAAKAQAEAEKRRRQEQMEEEERLEAAEERARQREDEQYAALNRQAIARTFQDFQRNVEQSNRDLEAITRQNQAAMDNYNASVARDRAAAEAASAARSQANAEAAAANAAAQRAREAQAKLAEAEKQAAAAQARAATPPATSNVAPAASANAAAPSANAGSSPQASAKVYPPVTEAVAVCIRGEGEAYTCYSPLNASGVSVKPGNTGGWDTPEKWLSNVGNCSGAGARGPSTLNGTSMYWSCGFGITSFLKDAASAAGAIVSNRGTFYCDNTETYCRRKTPTGN